VSSFPPSRKNEAVLEQIVEGREFFAKEGFARFGDDVFPTSIQLCATCGRWRG